MTDEGHLSDIAVQPTIVASFQKVLHAEEYRRLVRTVVETRARLGGRTIWNVNSTASGGGVAEMLESLVAYARGSGVDTRWEVVRGNEEFFRVTKRIHNQIQGFAGDGGPLGAAEHDEYRRALAPSAFELARLVRHGDVVLLHDPQTAGLAPELKGAGVTVVWRCHVGSDSPNDLTAGAWDFLQPYLAAADRYVFSRAAYAPSSLDRAKVSVIAPSIDPFTPKNNMIPASRAAAILVSAGIVRGYAAALPYFTRRDGSVGVVGDRAAMLEVDPLRPVDRFVTQVSRWDRLKDPVGVLRGFAGHVPEDWDVHLVLAGPQPGAVTDDPEGAATYEEVVGAWRALPEPARRRVHLANLPMRDPEQNAAMVNALQTMAAIVVQKSLAEGFGLTVAEAMWKGKPVVASRIGGIQDQIEDAQSGILLDDPTDLEAMGRALTGLLAAPQRAAAIGAAAHERVRRQFLSNRHLQQYAELVSRLAA